MGWPFNGNWSGEAVNPSILAALCVAVNERKEMVGVPEISFATKGASKTRPVASDFVGVATSSIAVTRTNLLSMQSAIEDMVGGSGNVSFPIFVKWAESNTIRTPLTLSTLLGLGSYGTSWVSLNSPDDFPEHEQASLQIRESLDALLYPIWWFRPFPLTIAKERKIGQDEVTLPAHPSLAVAWANAVAATPIGGNPLPPGFQMSHGISSPSETRTTATFISGSHTHYGTEDIKGVLLAGIGAVEFTQITEGNTENVVSPKIDVTFTDGKSTFTMDAESTPTDGDTHTFFSQTEELLDWPNVGSNTTPAVMEPVSFAVAFNDVVQGNFALQRAMAELSYRGSSFASTENQQMRAYTDASAEFADQA